MSYQLLLTDAGAAKVAAAANAGGLIHLTDFVIGQGVNVDFGTRLDKQVLVSKRYQGKVESVTPKLGNSRQYEITCIVPPDVGGFTIREFGLIDDTGVLIWVGSLPEVQKPDATSTAAVDYRIKAVVQVDNPQVSIVIDANVVTATQNWASSNFVSKPQFAQFLDLLFPLGYKYWSHLNQNPKPLFDTLFGYETFWRRLEGVQLVAVQDSDPYINQPMQYLGQKGLTDTAISVRPHQYPLYTSYLFERYDPDTVVNTVWQISADKNSLPEGDTVRFKITANNIPDGQILNWSITEGDVTSNDKTANGTVIMQNGQAEIIYSSTPDDNISDPNKQVRLIIGAPADLNLTLPIIDKGHTETVLHISQSTYNGITLDDYYKQQAGSYPSSTDTVRFIVDSGVDIVAPNTLRAAIESGNNWADGSKIIIENHGRILGHGGRGGDGGTGLEGSITENINGTNYGHRTMVIPKPPKNGEDGGTAINGNKKIYVENYGIVAGGGGGGAGGVYYPVFRNISSGEAVPRWMIHGASGGGGAPFGIGLPNPKTTDYLFNYVDWITGIDAVKANYQNVQPINGYIPHSLEFYDYPNYTNPTYDGVRHWSIKSTSADANLYKDQWVPNTTNAYIPSSTLGDIKKVSDCLYAFPYSDSLDPKKYTIPMLNRNSADSPGYPYTSQHKHGGDVTLTDAGLGGYTFIVSNPWASSDPTDSLTMTEVQQLEARVPENHAGHGGAIGVDGEDAVQAWYLINPGGYGYDTTVQYTLSDTPPPETSATAKGGKAGYIYRGDVIINNINGGATKGRTA